ncbi:MAG: hypothetical protein EOO45_17840 [Flavobacterium sp.]|nr:MAG: hypothetical protein EOO45_17840 [Flavobacterium sp.]
MKQKLAQFTGGVIIYGFFGIIMVIIAGDELENRWLFAGIWTVFMSVVHVLVMEPLRQRMAAKNSKQVK